MDSTFPETEDDGGERRRIELYLPESTVLEIEAFSRAFAGEIGSTARSAAIEELVSLGLLASRSLKPGEGLL